MRSWEPEWLRLKLCIVAAAGRKRSHCAPVVQKAATRAREATGGRAGSESGRAVRSETAAARRLACGCGVAASVQSPPSQPVMAASAASVAASGV